ncbi:MAG TPA: secondary thiamine-phosphate synthase enzyme YjbQ [Candidatus Omnitrophota bacterium]|jgi:secondary thiamine-phosphate synthase enzyme|nr:secondary thiamine-phosphate synthase enzyme YjbQ [Candidatus Omnitrophota bacterium]HSA30345.1 secondary thiamine-phosphate synthase enzyme YjbQ [Candidatus Omnitrophota bacterium]
MEKLNLRTASRQEIIDITPQIKKFLSSQKAGSGIVLVFSPHTTAGITVNENADPDVKTDLTAFLSTLVPQNPSFQHAEGNSDSHIKGSLVNFSQAFIVENGQIQLGTWQSIFFMEFDGPRNREIWLQFTGSTK